MNYMDIQFIVTKTICQQATFNQPSHAHRSDSNRPFQHMKGVMLGFRPHKSLIEMKDYSSALLSEFVLPCVRLPLGRTHGPQFKRFSDSILYFLVN
ncbi:hypothetical protein AD951_02940 [Acetobacter malorum]|uniref:Uncharacterized protein n=1 Tax=Acetobacter malorum TaxID=178901 RepID=A0A149UQZ6_9PROT|nr:hypothetical protein AD951_02940 [Acetobacter malorum]